MWQEIRNGSTNCTDCMETLPCQSHYLTFGGYPDSSTTMELHSKIALTAALSVLVDDGPDQLLSSGQPIPSATNTLPSASHVVSTVVPHLLTYTTIPYFHSAATPHPYSSAHLDPPASPLSSDATTHCHPDTDSSRDHRFSGY